MSSFDYTDNFSGFNDLFNRVEFLQEKDFKDMVKGSKLSGIVGEYGEKGAGLDDKGKPKSPIGPKSRIKNVVNLIAMLEMGIIDQNTYNILFRKAPSSTDINDLIKELVPDVYEELFEGDSPKSKDVVEYIEKDKDKKVQFAVMNHMNKNKEYVRFSEDEIKKAKERLTDEIEDDADKEVKLAKGLVGKGQTLYSKEVDAKISELDFDDVDVDLEALENKDEVAAKIVELLNTTKKFTAEVTPIGFNIEGPVGAFVNLDTIEDQMNRLITKYFPEHGGRDIPVRLHTSVPEEEYEQVDDEEYEGPSMANDPGGAPSSYAANEEGGGLTTPEDAEDEFNELENKRERARDLAGAAADKGDWDEWNRQENERESARDQLRDSEDNELDHFLTKEQPEDNIPATDYESVIADLVSKDKKEHALKQLNGDKDDGGHIDDLRAEDPPDPFGGGYEDEERITIDQIERDISNGMTFKESMISNKVDPSHWNNLLDMYTEYMEDRTEGPFETGFENEEEFNYSPMLDSYKTSTAGYLTEQAASDNRNKKSEVKKKSFKEKYKPKTHWQLEELRRYGL